MRTGLAFLTSCVFLLACSDDGDPVVGNPTTGGGSGGSGGEPATGGIGGTGGAPPAPLELVWEACPLFSDGTGPAAECARPELPLRAAVPDGEKLPLYVKRYAPVGGTREKQLWMLSGGPGASSIIYEARAQLLAEQDPTLEIYLPDHRGTGDSSRLGCPNQESETSQFGFFLAPGEWPACWATVEAEWGERLNAFNVTNAANDIGLLVEAARRPEAQVFVFGASYGTFWAQRYLQLFPDQADAVILDAIAPPDASLARQDLHADEASADLFQECADDPACGPKLDGDPRAFALDLYDRLDTGFCPEIQNLGPARILLRRAFGQMLMTWNARQLIPAALARADRCSPEDVAAIGALFDFYFGGGNDLLLREWGWVLSYYVTFSELWETPEVTVEQMAAWRDNAAVSRDVTGPFEAPLAIMSRYPRDDYYGGFARTSVPILMLQGTWDPATRPGPAEKVGRAFTGANQYWVEIPRGAHGALGSVPTVDGELCGTNIFHSFLADPSSPPDTSCLADAAPVNFAGFAELNLLLFGTEDAWGGL